MNLTSECKNILEDIKLKEVQEFNEFGFEKKATYNHDFFNPNRHIPPTNPTHDLNISPVIGELFAATLSMMNAQVLTQTNGCNKYV